MRRILLSLWLVTLAGTSFIYFSCGQDDDPSTSSGQAQDDDSDDDSDDTSADDDGGSGCGESDGLYPSGATTEDSFDAGEAAGGTRTFRVHVPASVDDSSPVPLVLMFHGGYGSGEQLEERSSKMDEVADANGFVAVYPDGTGSIRTWNGGGCCGYAMLHDIDDVDFVRQLIDRVSAHLCIDEKRVFAAGMSNGAILSHRLACELSDRIAAVGPVSGTDNTDSCAPSRPVPILMTHGTGDLNIPWDGGQGCGTATTDFTSVPETLSRWSERNGCSSETEIYFEQGDGTCVTQKDCADGADAVLCTIEGGGHSWPGGEPKIWTMDSCEDDGPQSTTFMASEVLWQFFSTHPMP